MPIAIIGSPPFRTRMREIRQFLVELGAVQAYDRLRDDMPHIIFPTLRTFPLIGKLHLDGAARSTEALMAMAKLPRDAAGRLRQYVHGDFTILYSAAADAIHLVSIRHHQESTFIP
jgi:hypothetical protein